MEKDKNEDINPTEYTEEKLQELQKKRKEYLKKVSEESLKDMDDLYKEGDGDLMNVDFLVSMPIFSDGSHSIRNADIKLDKVYLDIENKRLRYITKGKNEGSVKGEATIFLNPDEKRLSDIITQLPYGLIDKQVTGIGATHLEMYYSERNSIIVVPTRALGESKSMKDSERFLYVGTKKSTGNVTENKEIKKYLNNPAIKFKKILVVADSLKRVITVIQENKEDVYSNYFLMVDEIDTIQSDNHFRPQLSDVIDYYYKFKLQRRALVSATVKDFSHPKLHGEPLTTIRNLKPQKRKIDLLYSNDISKSLSSKINEIQEKYPLDKILIAYNSIDYCLDAIKLLSTEIKDKCGILCSESSYDKVELPLQANISEKDILSHKITFMTCAFFAGIDIKDKCHLITVSSTQRGYTFLSINKMTQIHGRCRDGILSDTIIYNISNRPFKYKKEYRKELEHKSQKVIEFLRAADNLKKDDEVIQDLFNRIQSVILEKADERFFPETSITLVRENIEKHWEISYFNIDVLCEQMESYSRLYAHKDGLYKVLKEIHNVDFKEDIYESEDNQKNQNSKGEEAKDRVKLKIQNCITDLIANKDILNDKELDRKIRYAKRDEKEFFIRLKKLYQYIEIEELTSKLYEICTKDVRSYKTIKNGICFWALEEYHPFKAQIQNNFKIGTKYSSEEIAKHMSVIINDQFFKKLSADRKFSQHKLVALFKSILDYTYTGGQYIVIGYKSKELKDLKDPLKMISRNDPAINYFEI